MSKTEVMPSRRQVILTTVLYLMGSVPVWQLRGHSEVLFYVALFCLTFWFLVTAGGFIDDGEAVGADVKV